MATQQWSDRGVLITGASKGLGRALALELAARGARLALVARRAEALAETVREIRAQGGEAHPLAFDVGDKDAVYPLAGAAQALLGRVDMIVHAASTLGVSLFPRWPTRRARASSARWPSTWSARSASRRRSWAPWRSPATGSSST